jgi:HK97 family phage prohead protease
MKKEGDNIVFIASDETLDRQGEVISLESWDLRNFKKNPVLLVDHEYKVENIVGTAKNIKIDKTQKALTFEPSFHKITPLSQYVSEMVDKGELSTVSVGFMPIFPKKDGDKTRNELLEISFVAVPANPNATMILSAEQVACVKSFVDETVEKEGRTLSKKTRATMMDAVGAMSKAVETLNELITNADANDEAKSIIKSVKELKDVLEDDNIETIEVDAETLETLVDDSEKLETLTSDPIKPEEVDEEKDPQNDESVKAVFKSIAREVNDVLFKMNRKV